MGFFRVVLPTTCCLLQAQIGRANCVGGKTHNPSVNRTRPFGPGRLPQTRSADKSVRSYG
jgi:hypothetical protein